MMTQVASRALSVRSFVLLLVLAAWFGFAAMDANAVTIGPGDTVINQQDTAFDLLVVDLTTPATLASGAYTAS